jgi:c(7)-type cytochrome triheme protein
MEGIFSGEWCGACHDGDKAFGADECEKCHVEKKFWLIKNII